MSISPDYSFHRQGLAFDEWLEKLFDESKETRLKAGDALQAMEWGLPSLHTDWSDLTEFPDTDAQRVRFAAMLKETIAQESFDTVQFVEKLAAFRIALSEDWQDHFTQRTSEQERFDRVADRIVASITATSDEASKQNALKRLARVAAIQIGHDCEQSDNPEAQAEIMLSSGMAAYRLFSLLDQEFMAVPSVLEVLLASPKLRCDALSALERIGPLASRFAPQFLQELDRLADDNKAYYHFDAALALGSIGRDDPFVVNEMIARLTSKASAVRRAAASVLQQMEQSVCGREEEICNLLLPMLQQDDEGLPAIFALAAVGRDLPAIRAVVLSLARPHEQKLRPVENYPEATYDLAMYERGYALSAIRYFTAYPEECLPVLIEAMNSFEEFDPDEGYHGPLSRIATVIGLFGPQASSAVMPLAEHLADEPDTIPSCILETLTLIGPASRAALPALHELRAKFAVDEPMNLNQKIDKNDDLIGWTIQQIQGMPLTQPEP
jgi:hypothetical protein